jgi:hypothetical protein
VKKAKALRLAGFVGALCASGALLGTSISSTGAYFTDSHDGAITASSGHLKLSVGDTYLSFTGLVPGKYDTQNIGYSTDSSTNEDVWMVFDTTSAGYGALSGASDNSAFPGGGLGRYGHFAVANNHAPAFTSYNLAGRPAGDTATDDTCAVDGNGRGGSNDVATPTHTPKYCAVPGQILLASNLPSGSTGEIEVTFGVTPKWTDQSVPVANVRFKIVATQHGVQPSDPYNP